MPSFSVENVNSMLEHQGGGVKIVVRGSTTGAGFQLDIDELIGSQLELNEWVASHSE